MCFQPFYQVLHFWQGRPIQLGCILASPPPDLQVQNESCLLCKHCASCPAAAAASALDADKS